jgi:hypothetical protein
MEGLHVRSEGRHLSISVTAFFHIGCLCVHDAICVHDAKCAVKECS